MSLQLIQEDSAVATRALVALGYLRANLPEYEIPPRLAPRLAGIALRMVVQIFPSLPPPPKTNGHRLEAIQGLPIPALPPPPPLPEIDYDPFRQAGCCRALLLEIIRRAAYDWVLYRLSSDLANKRLAEDAFEWLFVEDAASKASRERAFSGKSITSLLSICEQLDMAPEKVRARVRKLTIKDVMSVGRPAEKRHPPAEECGFNEHPIHLSADFMSSIDQISVSQ